MRGRADISDAGLHSDCRQGEVALAPDGRAPMGGTRHACSAALATPRQNGPAAPGSAAVQKKSGFSPGRATTRPQACWFTRESGPRAGRRDLILSVVII